MGATTRPRFCLGSLDKVGCEGDVCRVIVLALDILRLQQGTGLFSGGAALVQKNQSHQSLECALLFLGFSECGGLFQIFLQRETRL